MPHQGFFLGGISGCVSPAAFKCECLHADEMKEELYQQVPWVHGQHGSSFTPAHGTITSESPSISMGTCGSRERQCRRNVAFLAKPRCSHESKGII